MKKLSNKIKRSCLTVLLLSAFTALGQNAISTWTDINGKTVQARFLSLENQTVTLQRADGRLIKLPLHRFNDASVAKAQALAAPDEAAVPNKAAAEPDAAAPAKHQIALLAPEVHGAPDNPIAVLTSADISLIVDKSGSAFLTCTGGETFPLELSPRVYLISQNGEKDRINGKPEAAPKVSERDVVLQLRYSPEIEMELHYELDLKGECTVWYRFKNTGDQKAGPQARVRFPQLVGPDASTGGFAKNRTNESLSKAQLKSWLDRKTLRMSGFEGYGSDKMDYTEPIPKDASATFKSLSVDRGAYHAKSIRIDAPKSRGDAHLQFFMVGGQAPMNGFGIRLVNKEPWEKSDRSLGMTISF